MGMNDEEKEIRADFVNEASEGLEKAETLLLQMEDQLASAGGADNALVDSLFRVFHSIKGNAGFLQFKLINALTHQAESLLDHIRKGKRSLQKTHIDLFFEVCDALQMILDHIKEHGEEHGFQSDFSDLQNRLRQITESADSQSQKTRENLSETTKTGIVISARMKKEFADETRELLDQLEQDLMALEKNPEDMERLNNVFRALHTIKGNAGFLGFTDISQLCHKAENIFEAAREQTILLEERQISLMLQIIDFIGAALEAIKEDKPPIIAGKNALLDLMDDIVSLPDKTELAGKEQASEPKQPFLSEQKNTHPPSSSRFFKQKLSDVIRVDIEKLNQLMDLVGEIVIAESTLLNRYVPQNGQEEDFLKALLYLQKNIRELQDLATSMRMVPLSGLLGKMHRLVRDISSKKEKEVEFIVNGDETEVDRSIIEHISDPLIHILRNALDHGIETPEQRLKKGKPRKGKIVIDVQRVGGQIWITVKDDGQGLNKDKILQRAWQRGLIPNGHIPEEDQSIYNLIFEPGFSTADKITNISGRGVGMDVVQKNIEKIRGSISLSTVPNSGTTIIMKIPLTTAIIDAMLVRSGETLYAIPILDIRESLQVGHNQTSRLVDGQQVINVRGQFIPVMHLQQFHRQSGSPTDSSQEDGIVVISEIGGKTVGFRVDEILGEQQLVLKPLPDYLGTLEGVSGCAVLGNGAICLVLDLGAMLGYLEAMATNTQWKIATVEA